MSNESLVLVDRRSDGVALVTLNSPKVNALSTALLGRLHDVEGASDFRLGSTGHGVEHLRRL